MLCRALKNHGDDDIAYCRRQENQPQIHGRVKDPVAQREPLPAQQLQGKDPASEGGGHGKEDQAHPQQPLAPAKGGGQHEDGSPQLAQRMEQKTHVWEKDRRGIGRAQGRAACHPQPPQRLPRELGRSEQQQIIHHEIEQKKRIDIDDGHVPLPPVHVVRQSSL